MQDGPGPQTLAPCHDLGDRSLRQEGAKDMDMIWTYLHFLNHDVILLGNSGQEFLHPLLDLATYYVSSVPRRPDHMGEGIIDSMGCSSEGPCRRCTPPTRRLAVGIEC
jgi:hypothetical protein